MRLSVFAFVLAAAALAAAALAACDANPTSTCPTSDAVVVVADSVVGNGQPASGSVTVAYSGSLASNGSVFDSSPRATFALSGVIAGFRQGIGGRTAIDDAPAISPMRPGGIRRITIPTAFAYGAFPPTPAIPQCADLVFDVTLIDP